MKFFSYSIYSLMICAPLTSFTAHAVDTAGKDAEKMSAKEYWAEFKQDSKQTWRDSREAFKDGWIESKLQTALTLNKHLDGLDIDVGIENNVATLSGTVRADAQKELAENIALGIEGIDSVENNLRVAAVPEGKRPSNAGSISGKNEGARRSFLQYIDDVSTTAAIKTELLASKNVEGLEINVETFNNVVTLSGEVDTDEQKELAQVIAAKQQDVKSVINHLKVKDRPRSRTNGA